MKRDRNGCEVPEPFMPDGNPYQFSVGGTSQFVIGNPTITIENNNGDLHINAKKVFINGKEIK